MQMKTRKII